MTKFIDSIFTPVFYYLNMFIGNLASIRNVAAKGIRLNDYFGFFNVLGPAWTGVITSFLAAFLFIFILYMMQKYSRIILWFKDLIKWW